MTDAIVGEFHSPPKLSIVGMDIVRSDRAKITRSVVSDVLDVILRTDDITEARGEVYDIISTEVAKVENGEHPPSYISRPRGMSKQPEEYGSLEDTPMPTYRGAKYANQHFEWENIDSGSQPELLYIEKVRGDYSPVYTAETKEGGNEVDAIAVENPDKVPDEFVINTEKMLRKTVRDPLVPILSALHWDYDEALANTQQGSLEEFF